MYGWHGSGCRNAVELHADVENDHALGGKGNEDCTRVGQQDVKEAGNLSRRALGRETDNRRDVQ
eukprot:scaffold62276_cov32-Prasinocladus_malaysianus.AAC.1